ncbi:MAG: hypothetical protein A7315_01815 [Candidatus Altiarchaeales archaeon WOR_SM1_79]|nr:MAG: hypothetical protein A7315_01815 [Candidatus Altiarchaeales archaeon WOR_SM1_79]
MIDELTIEVAEHPISLEVEGEAFLHSIREVYHRFLSDKHPECRLRVYPDNSLTVEDESSVGLTFTNGGFMIVEDYLVGSVDLTRTEGELRINPIWFIPSLATFVRNLFTLILVLKDNGLVLHALGVLKQGEVYVFLGPSGSGKTTVAQLSPEYVVLSDDIVFIKPFGGSYAVFPTPCWGDTQRGDRENRGYPLKMIFKLVKDREVYLKPYGLTQGISEVFTVPHIPGNSLPFGDLLNRYLALLTEVPCFEMHFAKDGRFWEAIEDGCPGKF